MQVAISSEWIIDIGLGAGDEGGKVVAQGSPEQVAQSVVRWSPSMLYVPKTKVCHSTQ